MHNCVPMLCDVALILLSPGRTSAALLPVHCRHLHSRGDAIAGFDTGGVAVLTGAHPLGGREGTLIFGSVVARLDLHVVAEGQGPLIAVAAAVADGAGLVAAGKGSNPGVPGNAHLGTLAAVVADLRAAADARSLVAADGDHLGVILDDHLAVAGVAPETSADAGTAAAGAVVYAAAAGRDDRIAADGDGGFEVAVPRKCQAAGVQACADAGASVSGLGRAARGGDVSAGDGDIRFAIVERAAADACGAPGTGGRNISAGDGDGAVAAAKAAADAGAAIEVYHAAAGCDDRAAVDVYGYADHIREIAAVGVVGADAGAALRTACGLDISAVDRDGRSFDARTVSAAGGFDIVAPGLVAVDRDRVGVDARPVFNAGGDDLAAVNGNLAVVYSADAREDTVGFAVIVPGGVDGAAVDDDGPESLVFMARADA